MLIIRRISLILILSVLLLNRGNFNPYNSSAHPEAEYVGDFVSTGLDSPSKILHNGTHIIVVNLGNNIQIYNLNGQLVDYFPKSPPGIGPGEVLSVSGIASNGTHFFVADLGNSRIQIHDNSGNYVGLFKSGINPKAITFNGTHLFVADVSFLHGRLYVYDMNGNPVDGIEEQSVYEYGYDVKLNGTHIFESIASPYLPNHQNRVIIYENDLSEFTRTSIGKFNISNNAYIEGTGPGEFNSTRGIEISKDYLFVVDYYNSRVQVFNPQLQYLTEFGSFGNGSGQFMAPTGIMYNGTHVFVADELLNTIQLFEFPSGIVTYTKTETSTQTETQYEVQTTTLSTQETVTNQDTETIFSTINIETTIHQTITEIVISTSIIQPQTTTITSDTSINFIPIMIILAVLPFARKWKNAQDR